MTNSTDKAEYYTTLSTINDAGYCSSFVKRINSDCPTINVCRYCQAVNSFMAGEYGRTTKYKYAVQIDGTLIDNEYNEVVYSPEGALRTIIDSAREAYNTTTRWTDSDKILRLAQFTDGIDKVIQRASGRTVKLSATVMPTGLSNTNCNTEASYDY